MKTCNVCNVEKPTSEFYVYARNKDGLRKHCKKCASKRSNEWARNNKEKVSRIQKRTRLKNQYGLTEQEFLEMSKNGCQVCGSTVQLAVDHDHKCCPGSSTCGQCVRGVLCKKHNTALGLVNDSVEELEALIAYLGVAT